MQSGVDCWRVGDVTVTRIPDLEVDGFSPDILQGGLTKERVLSVDWLRPNYVTPEGVLRYSFHAYVVETMGKRIVVDTCVGNDKPRLLETFNRLATPFLERLGAAGFATDDIDYVLCTHLHVDHVGWNTRWNGETWVPTFSNARYLFGRIEWDHWKHEIEHAKEPWEVETRNILQDSVVPVVDAGLHDLVETDHRVTDEVRLFPTPGHTPGHVSVAISSRGQRAVIVGDVMHHPIQIWDPTIGSIFCTDPGQAGETRHAFVEDHSDKDVLVLGTHFARPSGGWIVRDGETWRFTQTPNSPAE